MTETAGVEMVVNQFLFLSCFNLAIHFIQSLIGKRILIDQIAYNDQKDGGNDRREYQNGVLCDLRIIGQFWIIGIYRRSDEGCQEYHDADAKH